MERPASVYVVDDDLSLLRALSRLLRVEGYAVETFTSPQEFVSRQPGAGPACLVLDLHMPGMDGLEVQELVRRKGEELPIVFLTGSGSIPASVKALKQGAVDFLLKPVAAGQLLGAVSEALGRHRTFLAQQQKRDALRRLVERLTPREREVALLVAQGRLNKQIAGDLGIAEKTVKIHRGRVMAKTGVRSVPELVRILELIGANLPEVAVPPPLPSYDYLWPHRGIPAATSPPSALARQPFGGTPHGRV